MRALFESAGLRAVEVQPLQITTQFEHFEDYWAGLANGYGNAPDYVRSLTNAQRERLREQIWNDLPVASDGSISLTALAWTIRGTRI